MSGILVPIDGTPASSMAIDFAITIAKARGNTLAFCYALDMRMLCMGSSVAMDPSWIESLRPDAEKVGRDALSRAAAADVPATLQIRVGLAEDVVLELATSCAMVVIGTRALGGLRNLLQHSITKSIVRASPCPVLVVRASDEAPVLDANGNFWKRVIAPIDGSKPSQDAIDVASTFALERDWELLFVYAVDPSLARAFSGRFAFDAGGAFEVMQRFGADLLARAEARARGAGLVNVSARLVKLPPIDAIVTTTVSEHADAIIIGTHGRHGIDRALHGSFTEELIRKSAVPIITLHTMDENA